jgi:hypothetical protein
MMESILDFGGKFEIEDEELIPTKNSLIDKNIF